MAIKSDKSKVTLDFECEINEETYMVRFHHTEELGQTISVCEKDSDTYIGYPVDLFTEIVDFLRSQKVIGHQNYIAPSMSRSQDSGTVVVNKENILPMPKINENENDSQQFIEPVEVNGDPVQSFSSVSKEKSENKITIPAPTPPNDEDIDLNELAEERKLAVEKAKLSAKSIHKIEDK